MYFFSTHDNSQAMYIFSTRDNSQAILELNGDKGTFSFNEFMTLQYETLNRQHLNSFFCTNGST